MTALITAVTGFITAVALLLAAIFLLRMVRPLSVVVLLMAENGLASANARTFLFELKDRLLPLLNMPNEPLLQTKAGSGSDQRGKRRAPSISTGASPSARASRLKSATSTARS
jgi:hypothetical protein